MTAPNIDAIKVEAHASEKQEPEPSSDGFKIRLDANFRGYISVSISHRLHLKRLQPVAVLPPEALSPIYTYIQATTGKGHRLQIPSDQRATPLQRAIVQVYPLSPDGFLSSLTKGYQIAIPRHIQRKLTIYDKDIISVTIETPTNRLSFSVQVHQEHLAPGSSLDQVLLRATIPKRLQEHFVPGMTYYISRIQKTPPPETPTEDVSGLLDLADILREDPDLITANHSPTTIQVWSRTSPRANSIIVNRYLALNEDLVKYLVRYFARGHRQGKGWTITVPSPNQLQSILQQHARIIPDDSFSSRLVFTKAGDDPRTEENIRKDLLTYWRPYGENMKPGLQDFQLLIRPSASKTSQLKHTSWRSYGTFYLTDSRILSQTIYNHLIMVALSHHANRIFSANLQALPQAYPPRTVPS